MVVFENISEYIIQMHNETIVDCMKYSVFNPGGVPVYVCTPSVEKTINIITIIICLIILFFIIRWAYKKEKQSKEEEEKNKPKEENVS